jgi:hypothetical protein
MYYEDKDVLHYDDEDILEFIILCTFLLVWNVFCRQSRTICTRTRNDYTMLS